MRGIKKIAVFDFDGTLFASPGQPDWWPFAGFGGKLESLSPPCVPEEPDVDWWNGSIVSAARAAIRDPHTYAVFMTGRSPAFRDRIMGLLESVRLRFDDHFFTINASTLNFKTMKLIGFAAKYPGCFIEMWDDRQEHLDSFEETLLNLQAKGMITKFKLRHVDLPRHEFEPDCAQKLAQPSTQKKEATAKKMTNEMKDIMGGWRGFLLRESTGDVEKVEAGETPEQLAAYPYCSIILDESSQIALRAAVNDIKNKLKLQGMKGADEVDPKQKLSHHVTINMGKNLKVEGYKHGDTVDVNVSQFLAHLSDDKANGVAAVKVDGLDVESKNPHITVLLMGGMKPVDGSKLKLKAGDQMEDKSIPATVVETLNLSLRGIVNVPSQVKPGGSDAP